MTDSILGYVEGYKVLRYDRARGVLHSPVQDGFQWDSPLREAECAHNAAMAPYGFPVHKPGSDPSCRCGMYASSNLNMISAYAYTPKGSVDLLARVRGYGCVTEGSKAWRSEKMEVMGLMPIRSIADSLDILRIRYKTNLLRIQAMFLLLAIVMTVIIVVINREWSLAPIYAAIIALNWYSARSTCDQLNRLKKERSDSLDVPEVISGIKVYRTPEEFRREVDPNASLDELNGFPDATKAIL